MPRAHIVPGGIAGGCEDLHGERGAASGVAVRDDLRSLRRSDERANGVRVRCPEQRSNVEVTRAGYPPRPWIARSDELAAELVGAPNVEQDERRIVEPFGELRERDVAHATSDATVSSSAMTESRFAHSWSQRSIAGYGSSDTSISSRSRTSHGR